jgi:hypothetical protein
MGTSAVVLAVAGAVLLLVRPANPAFPAGALPRAAALGRHLCRRIGALLLAAALMLVALGMAAAATGAPTDAPAAGPSARTLTPAAPGGAARGQEG